MDELLEAIREACGSARWSQGVRLAREGAVRAVSAADDPESALVLRVVTRGGLISPRVILYPEDPDWSCECGGSADACEHAAAAAIAWSRDEVVHDTGHEGDAARDAAGPIAYRLAPVETGVEVRRVVTGTHAEQTLEGRLSAIAEGRAEGPRFVATPADLEVETILAGRARGAVPTGLLPRLFGALSGVEDISLDGRPVRTSGEPILPRVVVEARPEGFLVRARAQEGLEAVLPGGSALVDGVLRPLGDPGLTTRERSELAEGRLYPHTEAARLFGEILPRLSRRLPVEGGAEGLPVLDRGARARLAFDLAPVDGGLEVRADIVYGAPAVAKVSAGRLQLLGQAVPERDGAAESRLERDLSSRFGLVAGERVRLEGDAAIALVGALAGWLPAEVSGALREAFRVSGDLVPEAARALAAGDLALEFAMDGEAGRGPRRPRASAATAFAAWERGERHVRLSDGSWGRLPGAWLEAHAPLLRDLLAARDAVGALPDSTIPEQQRLAEVLGAELAPGRAALARRIREGRDPQEFEFPEGVRARLRGYQREGVRWLSRLGSAGLGALLADDMGLGKTIQAASVIEAGTLVACPTSVMHNWVDELARFRPDLGVSLFHGSARALGDHDVVVTSHALIRMDVEAFLARRWKLFVFDESQALRNPDSRLARAATALAADARIALSGTPVENRLLELWSQMHFLNPGLLGARRHFEEHYARPISAGDEAVAARLRRRIAPFVLRRLKSEVAPELPARTEVVLRCTLDERERAVYDAVRAATRKDLVERVRSGGSIFEALEALLRLRQAACHSALVPGQSAQRSSKIDLLLERVDEVAAEGRRALVFSQWTSLLDLIEPGLAARGIRHARLDGSTRDRAGVVARFQDESSECSVLLVSLKAGGAGLNLTAADHVFLVDPWWNPATEDQAADRAHRIGQTRPVFIYRLVAEDTVEERVLALQEEKRRLAGAALSEAAQAASLDRAEILALLD